MISSDISYEYNLK